MSDKIAKHKQPWKPEELQKLQILAGKGKGLKEIAKALNRTEESTKDAARQHDMKISKAR
jgi:hypothetical protein